MSRKSLFVGLALVLMLASSVSSVLAFLVRHEPAAYSCCALPPGEQRQKLSREYLGESSNLMDGIVNKRQWYAKFTEEQINGFFEEDFIRSDTWSKILPDGISEPRVCLQPDKIRLAFRYGTGKWSTVISVDLAVWLAAKEPNVVVLELQGLHAGSLPISAQSLLDRISEAARSQNLDITWYRHNGNPVALLRLQPYHSRPTFQLQRLELGQGTLLISGRSLDAAPVPDLPVSQLKQQAAN
jgi:hypothetical protein